MKTILVDAVDCFVIEDQGIFQEMFNLLQTFPNKKVILTGANDQQFLAFGLDKMPYEVFTLKHNPEKSDPKYFQILLQKLNLDKSEVIYFQHNSEAIKSAQSVGIKSYLYNSEKQDLVELKGFIVENL